MLLSVRLIGLARYTKNKDSPHMKMGSRSLSGMAELERSLKHGQHWVTSVWHIMDRMQVRGECLNAIIQLFPAGADLLS